MRNTKNALLLPLLLILIAIGCYWTGIDPMVKKPNPQNVNETIYLILNKAHLQPGDFLIQAGKDMNQVFSDQPNQIYKIRIEGGRVLDRSYEINMVVVYYE
jgi:hypothetical protein